MLINTSNNQPLHQKQFNGLLTCARYAFMPNKLQYCGGDKNSELFEYSSSKTADPILNHLLKEFQTIFPYLKLIAESNKIKDVFDYRVVEAYWIGNNLLENVNMNKLYWHFIDGLNLKRKMKPNEFEKIVGKIPLGAIPHHSFHVFNVYFRTGHIAVEHTIDSMNNCRIGWGKITKISTNELTVQTPALIIKNNSLSLSNSIKKILKYKFLDKGFIENPQIGNLVSYHWDWACEIINERQKENLKKYTQLSINLANKQSR